MKASQIRELRQDELSIELGRLERKLYDLRTQSVTEKLENTMLIKNVKHDIARFKTIIRETQLQAGK